MTELSLIARIRLSNFGSIVIDTELGITIPHKQFSTFINKGNEKIKSMTTTDFGTQPTKGLVNIYANHKQEKFVGADHRLDSLHPVHELCEFMVRLVRDEMNCRVIKYTCHVCKNLIAASCEFCMSIPSVLDTEIQKWCASQRLEEKMGGNIAYIFLDTATNQLCITPGTCGEPCAYFHEQYLEVKDIVYKSAETVNQTKMPAVVKSAEVFLVAKIFVHKSGDYRGTYFDSVPEARVIHNRLDKIFQWCPKLPETFSSRKLVNIYTNVSASELFVSKCYHLVPSSLSSDDPGRETSYELAEKLTQLICLKLTNCKPMDHVCFVYKSAESGGARIAKTSSKSVDNLYPLCNTLKKWGVNVPGLCGDNNNIGNIAHVFLDSDNALHVSCGKHSKPNTPFYQFYDQVLCIVNNAAVPEQANSSSDDMKTPEVIEGPTKTAEPENNQSEQDVETKPENNVADMKTSDAAVTQEPTKIAAGLENNNNVIFYDILVDCIKLDKMNNFDFLVNHMQPTNVMLRNLVHATIALKYHHVTTTSVVSDITHEFHGLMQQADNTSLLQMIKTLRASFSNI